jgi:hypothetical protein
MRNLFDSEFYLRANPDVAAARMDPLEHFLKYGQKEQRQPHPLFDPVHYLASTNPHPLFDCDAYLKAHPEMIGDPLEHYAASARRMDAPAKDAVKVRFVLLHYHFFKNAGTTVEDILAHSFFENYGRFDSEDFDGCVGQAELISFLRRHPRMKAVSSHQFRFPVPQEPGFLFFDLCFLRDPIDRIRSMYDYFREKPIPGEPASELARDQPVGGFIRGLVEEHSYRVSNVQVNMLANGIVNDLPVEADLDRATEVMLQMSFLGVVDLFNESLIAGAHRMRPIFPSFALAQQPANVSSGRASAIKFQEACDPDVYAELLRLNALDIELLNRARAEVQRRFALVPAGVDRLRELLRQIAA